MKNRFIAELSDFTFIPKGGTKAGFNPDQARDEDGKWTASGGGQEAIALTQAEQEDRERERRKIREKHFDVIRNYTDQQSDWINGYLRRTGGQVLSDYPSVTNLDAALDYWRSEFGFDGVSFRGWDADKEIIDEFLSEIEKGGTIKFPAFISTSKSFDTAKDFFDFSFDDHVYAGHTRGIIFEFRSKIGVMVQEMSQHGNEEEVLLPRGQHFKIIDIIEEENLDPAHGDNFIKIILEDEKK